MSARGCASTVAGSGLKGLRPVQIWVPDVRSPEFAREAYRQSAAVAVSRHAQDDQAFIDAISRDTE